MYIFGLALRGVPIVANAIGGFGGHQLAFGVCILVAFVVAPNIKGRAGYQHNVFRAESGTVQGSTCGASVQLEPLVLPG